MIQRKNGEKRRERHQGFVKEENHTYSAPGGRNCKTAKVYSESDSDVHTCQHCERPDLGMRRTSTRHRCCKYAKSPSSVKDGTSHRVHTPSTMRGRFDYGISEKRELCKDSHDTDEH